MRRVLRIFPLYYAALAVVLLVLPHLVQFDPGAKNIAAHQIWLWTYFANWPAPGWIWDDSSLFLLGHFWSLSVEEHFYFVWPSLVALCSGRTLCGLCASLLVIGILSRGVNAWLGAGAPLIFQWSTFQKVDGLAVGAILAVVLRDSRLARCLPAGRQFWLLLALLLVPVLTWLWLPRKMYFASFDIIAETLVAGVFGLLLLHALRSLPGSLSNRVLISRPLVAFGKYSYGLYVIHGLLRPCFARIFDMSGLPTRFGLPFLYQIVYYVFTIGISFGLAWLSYHFMEKRFLALKSHFEYQRSVGRTSEPAECLPISAGNRE